MLAYQYSFWKIFKRLLKTKYLFKSHQINQTFFALFLDRAQLLGPNRLLGIIGGNREMDQSHTTSQVSNNKENKIFSH